MILVNIESIKRSEMAIAAARDYAEIIVQTVQDPLLVLDRDLRIDAANTAFCRVFSVPAPELEGRRIYELDDQRWESPRLRRMLSRAFANDTVADLELALDCPALGRRTMRVSVRALDRNAACPERILLVMHDVTVRKRLETAVAETVEAERQRFGRDLHDGVAQELTGIGMLLTSFRNKLARMPSPLVAELDQLDRLLSRANDNARKLAEGSFPVNLRRGGLLVALRGLARDTEDSTGVSCTIESDDGPLTEASDTRAIQLFRIAQESIHNAIKHGGAQRIVVRLVTLGSTIVLTTTDDGSGLNEDLQESKGMGRQIMQYRAHMIGGELDLRNGDEGGAVVTCTIPAVD
jgi:PAS domain S-box-containing protein